jgi:multidrug transporter EmrE-like cation transporter
MTYWAWLMFGRFVFQEKISAATWTGLIVIILGGLIIQFSDRLGTR